MFSLVLDKYILVGDAVLLLCLTPEVGQVELSLVVGIDRHMRNVRAWLLEDVNEPFLLVFLDHLFLQSLAHHVGFHQSLLVDLHLGPVGCSSFLCIIVLNVDL